MIFTLPKILLGFSNRGGYDGWGYANMHEEDKDLIREKSRKEATSHS
jgi:hypothetical protein